MATLHNNKPRLIALLIAVSDLMVASCSPAPANPRETGFGQSLPGKGAGSYTDISPSELHIMIESRELFLVNVRMLHEGKSPGTETLIPFDQVREQFGRFTEAKDAQIVLYCRTGSMSTISSRSLMEEGYMELYTLDRGCRTWTAEGLLFGR